MTSNTIIALLIALSLASTGLSAQDKSSGSSKNSELRPPALKVGDVFPDFKLQTADGRLVSLSDFRGGSLVVNFWATWCPPCIHEMPSLDQLGKRFRGRPVSFLAISVDDSWNEILDFLSTLNREPSFLVLHDPGKVVAEGLLGINKYPESFIVDSGGRIREYIQGAIDWTAPEFIRKFELIVGEKD